MKKRMPVGDGMQACKHEKIWRTCGEKMSADRNGGEWLCMQ